MAGVVVTHDTETVFGADYSERTDECFSREIVMSMLKSASRFPYASLCAAVVLACSLAACGGGGGGSSGNDGGAGSGSRSGIGRSTDASISREQSNHELSLAKEDDFSGFDALVIDVLSNAFRDRFVGGQVIDPAGKVHTATQWMQHIQQHCPKSGSEGGAADHDASVSMGCLAGTYIGKLPDTEQQCRVTLAQDGSVTLVHNGVNRFLLRLTPDNARYYHGDSLFYDERGDERGDELELRGKENKLRPERQASVSLQMIHQVIDGRAFRVLNIGYEDRDLGPYLPAVDGVGPDYTYPCVLLHDATNATS